MLIEYLNELPNYETIKVIRLGAKTAPYFWYGTIEDVKKALPKYIKSEKYYSVDRVPSVYDGMEFLIEV